MLSVYTAPGLEYTHGMDTAVYLGLPLLLGLAMVADWVREQWGTL